MESKTKWVTLGYAGGYVGVNSLETIRLFVYVTALQSLIESKPFEVVNNDKISAFKMRAEFPVTKTVTTKVILQCNFLSVNNKQNNDMVIIFDTLSAS